MDILGIIAAIGLMLVLFALGMPVAFSMFVAGIVGLAWLYGTTGLRAVGWVLWNAPNNAVLTAVPLFILMGVVLQCTGLSKNLFKSAANWLAWLPGGLFDAVIGACTVFAAISGSSTATAAAIGVVSIPELEKRKYDSKIMLGAVAAGGTLGILIPPSITFIIYGAMVGESVGRLFIAGFIPGIVMSLMFMFYVGVRVLLNRSLAPKPEATPWKEKFTTLAGTSPVVILILAVLGTIYLGVATPTEAAALGVTVACILGIVGRSLSWQSFRRCLGDTIGIASAQLIIFVGASVLSMLLSMAGIPQKVSAFIVEANVHPYVFLAMVYVLYLILGCFFDPMSCLVLTLPLLYPTVKAMGFDGIWFGVVVVMLIQIGMVTPPVGLNLYVMQGIAPRYAFSDVVRGVMPFFCVQLASLGVVTAWPEMVTWLPSTMMGH